MIFNGAKKNKYILYIFEGENLRHFIVHFEVWVYHIAHC